MKTIKITFRLLLPLALTIVLLAPALAETSPERELEQIQNIYRAITSYHTLLQGDGVTKQMVDAALYDVEHYVDEIDSRYATDKLFVEDRRVLGEITKTVAKAHFQAALLHARGVDLEGSIVQYEKVLDLLGYDPADWDVDIERSGRPGLLSGVSEVVFRMTSPREAVEDLKHFWSAGVVTRFRVREFSSSQLEGMTLERIGGRNDAFSQASFELAQERFAERVKAGLEEFRVVLPPGRYRATAAGTGVEPLEFYLRQGGVPDPIVLNPNSFSFAFANEGGPCTPELYLNGLPVKNLVGLAYGTYKVKVPKSCDRRLPDKITVEQKAEVTLRTEPERLDYVKEGQPIFLFITTPPESTYTLRF